MGALLFTGFLIQGFGKRRSFAATRPLAYSWILAVSTLWPFRPIWMPQSDVEPSVALASAFREAVKIMPISRMSRPFFRLLGFVSDADTVGRYLLQCRERHSGLLIQYRMLKSMFKTLQVMTTGWRWTVGS